MQIELDHFHRRCRQPWFLANHAISLVAKAARSLMRRAFQPQHFYPKEVRRAWRKLERSFPAHRMVEHKAWERLPAGSLKLAIGNLAYIGEPNWNASFEDPEETESLHRWNWLLTSVMKLPQKERTRVGLGLVCSWASRRESAGASWGDNPYSIGERVSNFCLFWALTGNCDQKGRLADLPPHLRACLHAMVQNLADRLEYSSEDATGNHAFNNARALLLAGEFLAWPSYTKLALAIMRERLPKLVTNEGFLREGSSHYHFLFTRWVLEMQWVAEQSGQLAAADFLRDYSTPLVQKCWFFLVHQEGQRDWTIPLLGDVSPDFMPDWLIGLPWSPLALGVYRPTNLPAPPTDFGWSSLWPRVPSDPGAPQAVPRIGAQVFTKSHWHRVQHHDWTLFLHAGTDDGVVRASHRHTDLGGFVLFYQGIEVFADCGRANYRVGDPLGEYGLSAQSHNTMLLDGCGPMAELRLARLPPVYRAVNVSVEICERENEMVATLTHDGFSRLSGQLVMHIRSICLGQKHCHIDDQLSGAGRHSITNLFHCGPTLGVTSTNNSGVYRLSFHGSEPTIGWFGPAELVARCAPPVATMSRAQTTPRVSGWSSRVYGGALPCTTLAYRDDATLPFVRRYALNLESSLCAE